MKTEKNILIAFLLNLFFAVFELIGGILIGSVAILSDALHDTGDAVSIGFSFFLEKKSRKGADERNTYGYRRYSLLGGVITTLILIGGSLFVIYHAVLRIINPVPIHYDGMILFAVIGVAVNLLAAYFTREGGSLNQRAVNLHMLEDVLGWAAVLVGAIIMRFTDLALLDPLLSIGVSLFILVTALRPLAAGVNVFLEKAPSEISHEELKAHLTAIDGVLGVHHIHLWSLDGQSHMATLHLVIDGDAPAIKQAVREELRAHGIAHATLETEAPGEECRCPVCRDVSLPKGHHHHHHHHH